MTQTQREKMLMAVMIGMMCLVVLWCSNSMRHNSAQASRALADYNQCKYYVDQIQQLKAAPAVAADQDMAVSEFAKLVENSAAKSGLSMQCVQEISPQSSRRLGNSAYLQNPTDISIKGVSLSALVSFMYYLGDGSGLKPTALRIWVPYGQQQGKSWDADVTFTQMVYSPQSKTN